MKNLAAACAIIGGILWIVLNLALIGAWERGSVFPTYEFLNGARPLPLALLAFALYGIYRDAAARIARAARIGFYVALAGFGLPALGAALEFWIGGGVRDGGVDTLSLAGWLIYLTGYLVSSIGLILLGAGVLQARAWGDYSILPLLTGVVWAMWFPLIMVDQALGTQTSDWTQWTFGGLWIAMGVLMLLQTGRPVTRANAQAAAKK